MTHNQGMKDLNFDSLKEHDQNGEDEKTTYEKIEAFFQECKSLNIVNFEYFVSLAELNSVFEFDDINVFWRVFTESEEDDAEYDFDQALGFVQKLGEKYKVETDRGVENNNEPEEDHQEVYELKEDKIENNQTLSEILEMIPIHDVPDFLNFIGIMLKGKDHIFLKDIPTLLKKHRYALSEELLVLFFHKISSSQSGSILYINMDLFKIANSRLDQAIELENLNKEKNIENAKENVGTKLLEEIIQLQEDANSNQLIIQKIVIDTKIIFEHVCQFYNKIVQVEGNSITLDQIQFHTEGTYKKLKDLEIYNKKAENFNFHKTRKLDRFKEKYQIMEQYIDNQDETLKKKVSNNSLIDLSVSSKVQKAQDNEYINKLLKDIAHLEENQQNLEDNYENLKKEFKEKQDKFYEAKEENNLNTLEIKKQRLEIEKINGKLNAAREENDLLLKKTYKDIEERAKQDKQNNRKLQKSGSMANFEHLLENTLGSNPAADNQELKDRYNKLKKISTDIEKQKKVLEDINKDNEELIFEQKRMIYELTAEIKNLKLKQVKEHEDIMVSSKDIRRVLLSPNRGDDKSAPNSPKSVKASQEKKENDKNLIIDEINIMEDDEDGKPIPKKPVNKVSFGENPNPNPKSGDAKKSSLRDSPVKSLRRNPNWDQLMEIKENLDEPEETVRGLNQDQIKALTAHKKKVTERETTLEDHDIDTELTLSGRKIEKFVEELPSPTKEKKMSHHRSQSTMGYAKTTSVFLLLNKEEENENACSLSIAEDNFSKIEEEKKVDEERRKKTIDFVETASYDFLFKKSEVYLRKLWDNEKNCEVFSDSIYLYDCSMVRSKVFYDLIVTKKHIYLLNAGKDVLKSIFKLENLFRITVSNKNFNLLVLHFTQGDDLIVNIFRRTAFLSFLRKNYILPNKKDIKFYFSECIKIQIKYSIKDLIINVTEQNYEHCVKLGWVTKYCLGIFKNTFDEKFLVLSNVGLIYFDEPNKLPKRIVPLIGCNITHIDKNKYKKEFCFEIKSFPTEENFIFSALNQMDANSWVEELLKFKNSFEKKVSLISLNYNN